LAPQAALGQRPPKARQVQRRFDGRVRIEVLCDLRQHFNVLLVVVLLPRRLQARHVSQQHLPNKLEIV